MYCLTSSCDRLVSATTIRDSVFAFISKDNFFKLRRIVPSLDSNKHVVKARLQTVSDVLKALPYFSNLKVTSACRLAGTPLLIFVPVDRSRR